MKCVDCGCDEDNGCPPKSCSWAQGPTHEEAPRCTVCAEASPERTRAMLILLGMKPKTLSHFKPPDLARLYAMAVRLWMDGDISQVALPEAPRARTMALQLRRLA